MENNFSRNIKALRTALGQSQEQMSATLGVKRSTYSSWELGNSEPSLHALCALQEVHQVGVDVLLRATLHAYSAEQLRAARTAFAPRPRMHYAKAA
jgi:transcriptional regulator with XRE-family HTH domain